MEVDWDLRGNGVRVQLLTTPAMVSPGETQSESAALGVRSLGCLVICHKQLGDLTLLEPAMAKLAEVYGGVDLLTRSGHAALVSLMEGVRMISRPSFRRYAAVFCYDDLSKSAIHTFLVRAARKDLLLRDASECSWYHRMVFRSICAPGLGEAYLARYNWDNTLREVGASYRPPTLLLPPDSWKPVGFALESYLLINPTAGWKSKSWKVGSWVKVLRRLLEHDPEMNILITSGDQAWQMEHSQKIAKDLGARVHFLGGQTGLEAFLWLVSRSRMVLGVDGAASHLAEAFGRRSLTLFMKSNMMNWHEPGAFNVAIAAAVNAETGVLEIESEAVADQAISLWS